MSHIAEVYAKDLGVEIGRPYITDHFFPGLPDKYITVHSSNKTAATNYHHWDLVVGLIKPFLGEIKIVQVGDSDDEPIRGVDLSTLGNSPKQRHYIIKNSKTHVDHSGLLGDVASAYDIPSVALHFNLYEKNSRPIWHKNNSCANISVDFSKIKPSYSSSCGRINEIKPELIAQSILDQLKIDDQIKFKTIRIGSKYNLTSVDIVPDFFANSSALSGKPINIKADQHFDITNIIQWCRMCSVNLYTDKQLSLEEIKACSNLKQLVFQYSEEHKNTDLSKFLKNLKRKKINVLLQVEDESLVSSVRLKYFDFNVILKDSPETIENIPKNCKFISRKKFICNSQGFNSESSCKRLDKSENFVYDEVSKSEIESLYLYVEK
tara:strand:+ start:354 stop:1487 length:1134 start_codon:yes stop_codon:yes gene_type:complete